MELPEPDSLKVFNLCQQGEQTLTDGDDEDRIKIFPQGQQFRVEMGGLLVTFTLIDQVIVILSSSKEWKAMSTSESFELRT